MGRSLAGHPDVRHLRSVFGRGTSSRLAAAALVGALVALSLPLGTRAINGPREDAPLVDPVASVSGASFSGDKQTSVVDGVLYAKKNAELTLNVTTATEATCVVISGAHAARQTSNTAKTSWSFKFTAGDGSGVRTVNVQAYDHIATPCTNGTGTHATMDASYVLDNTGPAVSASLLPAANAAGWNNSPVAITWTGVDAGVGFTRKCDGSEHNPNPCTDSVTTATNSTTKTAKATDRLGNSGGGSTVVRLDTQPPTITGSRSPVQPASGWNNSDVTVTFACNDPKQGVTNNNPGFASGIKSCGPNQTLTTDGANQSVSGKAVDAADNEASVTMASINIDKTAPAVTGAATTSPNSEGWYKGDVTVAWTCSDGLSGLASACPPNSTIVGEGNNLGATSASVSDKAGNSGSTSVSGIKIDRTVPNTTATAPASDWNNTDVTVQLNGFDALSGVQQTLYSLDGGAEQAGTSIVINSEGTHTLQYWSVDKAGNVEPPKTVGVKIDKTKPTINHSQDPAANGNGWNNTDVTVTFVCADEGGSGIQSCTAPQTVSGEGKNHTVSGTAVDNAGNTATDPASVSIDKTPPTIFAGADRAPNANQWYKTDVTVSFSCGDLLSGIAVCPAAQTLGEGTSQSASGAATDAAGNSASTTMSGINVDKTPPAISVSADRLPNAKQWYNSDVTLTWTCTDMGGSGVDGSCPATSTVAGEGELAVALSVNDKAGNSTSTMFGPIKIDRTSPVTSASVPAATYAPWHKGSVAVTLIPQDQLSEVDVTYYSVNGEPERVYGEPFILDTTGIHSIMFWSVDNAGNVEDKGADGHTITVAVDNTPPSITHSISSESPDGSNGWYLTAPTVSFGCHDVGAGIGSCLADGEETSFKMLGEGKGQTVLGTATDVVGNTAQVNATGIDVDLSDPSDIQFIGGPEHGGQYTSESVPTPPTCTATDTVSLLASCVVSGYSTAVATHTLTATATDNAGRTATATRTYTVQAPSWTATGYYRPIDMSPDNATAGQIIWNTAKNGSTIPFKFDVFSGPGETNEVTDASKIKMSATSVSCSAGAGTEPVELVASGSTSLRYDATAGQFVYNWKTPTKANTCYRVVMTASNGLAVIDDAFIMLK